MIWYLIWVTWTGDGYAVLRLPQASYSECTAARTGTKIAAGAPTALSASGGGATVYGGSGTALTCDEDVAGLPAFTKYQPTTTQEAVP